MSSQSICCSSCSGGSGLFLVGLSGVLPMLVVVVVLGSGCCCGCCGWGALATVSRIRLVISVGVSGVVWMGMVG